MRSYIFSDRERRDLENWLQTGEEKQTTRNAFCRIRRNVPQLNRDMRLMLEVVKELQKLDRWRGRVTEATEFGSALLLAESALTRLRRGRST